MLKRRAFITAVTYVNSIANQEMPLKVARDMRDLMKPYIEFSRIFEEDRNKIIASELEDEKKMAEVEILLNEEVELPIITDELLTLCENGGIKISPTNLNALYE